MKAFGLIVRFFTLNYYLICIKSFIISNILLHVRKKEFRVLCLSTVLSRHPGKPDPQPASSSTENNPRMGAMEGKLSCED